MIRVLGALAVVVAFGWLLSVVGVEAPWSWGLIIGAAIVAARLTFPREASGGVD